MGSKFMRFGLIATAIINIILLMFVLIVRQFNYDEIIFKNSFTYNIFDKIDTSILAYYILLNMLLNILLIRAPADFEEIINFFIYYKIFLVFYIVVNILFLNIILKKKQNKLIYFVYIISNILFIIPIYVIISRGTILDVLTNYETFIGDNLFLHIIFFLEVVLPIIYFKNYKSTQKERIN